MTSGDVPDIHLRTKISCNTRACFEPTSAWDTPIFEAKELNLDRGVVISCSAHTSQDSGIVGTDFTSCGTRETAEDNTVRELSEGEGAVDVHLTRASLARGFIQCCELGKTCPTPW